MDAGTVGKSVQPAIWQSGGWGLAEPAASFRVYLSVGARAQKSSVGGVRPGGDPRAILLDGRVWTHTTHFSPE